MTDVLMTEEPYASSEGLLYLAAPELIGPGLLTPCFGDLYIYVAPHKPRRGG